MAKNTYEGDNGVDIVNQTNSKDYYNIITKGGDDEISITLTDTWVDAGDDNDWVKSTVEGANRIDLGGGADTYIGKGYAKSGRHDEVYGGAGDDTMTLYTRHSDYFGGGGDDRIESAGYWNRLVGGDGNDTVSYIAQDDDKYLDGWGVDLDLGREFARTGEGRKERIENFENAEGTSYGDGMIGSKGNNKLWGLDGQDDVAGMKGDDKLYGGDGDDYLYGGNGRDELTGGKGKDQLWGESGSDTFVFADQSELGKGSNADIIKDFEDGDKIDLSAVGSFTFVGDSAFSASGTGELRFEDHVLQGDVDGDGTVDFEIKVKDVNTLHDSDFVL
jgi:Ca2+-binding RTX toxin-like protein